MTKMERIARFYHSMTNLGFSAEEIQTLRRVELTLHRWAEKVCNGEIEYNEEAKKVYSVSWRHLPLSGESKIAWEIPNREAHALKRLEHVMAHHKDLWYYHQTDPRGCSLWIGKYSDLPPLSADCNTMNETIKKFYTRGRAVCL